MPPTAPGLACGPRPPRLRGVSARQKRESGFHSCAISKKGAKGLMQLMPATADQFHVKDPFDPQESLDAGAKFLRQLLGDRPVLNHAV